MEPEPDALGSHLERQNWWSTCNRDDGERGCLFRYSRGRAVDRRDVDNGQPRHKWHGDDLGVGLAGAVVLGGVTRSRMSVERATGWVVSCLR